MKKYTIVLFSLIVILQGSEKHRGFSLQVGEQGTGFTLYQTWRKSERLHWNADIRFMDVSGEDQLLVYDPYTNNYVSSGDKHVLFITSFYGVKLFPFAGQIENNFSPFVQIGIGPIFTIDGLNDESFKNRWVKATTLWSFGGYIGLGVDFLMSSGMRMTAGAGMDILPMNGIVEEESNYSGGVIQMGFNWFY